MNGLLGALGIDYADRWRDWGITVVFTVVNILGTLGIYWLARVPKGGGRK